MAMMMGLLGSVVSAIGTIAAGQAQATQAEYQAKQLEIKATEERAAAQREQKEFRRQADTANSRVQALSSAGGFGALDPSIVDLSGDIWARGLYQGGLAKYGGEERASGALMQARAARYEGKAARSLAGLNAFGTILGGFGGMAGSYG